MARITENLNGKILSRESCEFNKFGDVRTCLNWDTGASHKDMKNIKGEWYQGCSTLYSESVKQQGQKI